jgi:hypothetical protein
MTDDERLLTELAAAVRAAEQVPDAVRRAGQAAFGWRTVDAELAELAYDSADPPAGPRPVTRADRAELRALTFAADGVTLEVEITRGGLQGQVVPPQSGRIDLELRDGATEAVGVDEVGWFSCETSPHGLFRLRLHTGSGRDVCTVWTAA